MVAPDVGLGVRDQLVVGLAADDLAAFAVDQLLISFLLRLMLRW
jgi:hypothetical protein